MIIQTGFLTGNILDRDLSRDEAISLSNDLKNGLSKRFPESEIVVNFQHGSGSCPYDCKTRIFDDPESVSIDFVDMVNQSVEEIMQDWIAAL